MRTEISTSIILCSGAVVCGMAHKENEEDLEREKKNSIEIIFENYDDALCQTNFDH